MQLAQPPVPTKALLGLFDSLHNAKLGVRAVIVPGKDAAILARLWKSHSDLVDVLMRDYFESRDPFILRQGYSVGKFAVQFSMLLARRARIARSVLTADSTAWVSECIRVHGASCPHRHAHAARMGVESAPSLNHEPKP